MGMDEKPPIGRQQYLAGVVLLISALLLGAVVFFGMGTRGEAGSPESNATKAPVNLTAKAPGANRSIGAPAQNATAKAKENATAQPGNSTQPAAGNDSQPPAAKEVTVDFMYADWCPHCQAMKPVVAKIASDLPSDRFAVNYYSEADANAGKYAATMFAKYGIRSYPTFVINGNDRKEGEMTERDFLAWVCSKFSSPKPELC